MEFCGVESVSNCFTLWITPPWHGLTCTNPGAFSIGLPAYTRVPRVLKNCTSIILQFPHWLLSFPSFLSSKKTWRSPIAIPPKNLLHQPINPSTHQPQFSTGKSHRDFTPKNNDNEPTNQPTNQKPMVVAPLLGRLSGKAVEVQLFSSKHWQCHHR